MTSAVYRDDEDAVESRIETLVGSRANEAAQHNKVVRPILVRRAARVAAGCAGIAGGFATFATPALTRLWPTDGRSTIHPTHLLLGSWAAMGAAYLIGFAIAETTIRTRPATLNRGTSSPRRYLERLLATPVSSSFQARLARTEGVSVSVLLAAIALLAPLTIHWVVYAFLFGAIAKPQGTLAFDEWIGLSAFLVGLAHLCLFVCAFWVARELTTSELGSERKVALSCGWWTVLFTTCASAIPGAIYLLIPCVLTALTGAAFIPVTFLSAGERLRRERFALEAL